MFAIIGAAFYAAYSVVLKGKGQGVDMVLLFALVGPINFALFFIGIPILSLIGVEPWEMPNGLEVGFLIVNALFGTVLSDMLWALSVQCLNPTLCTVGLTLTIPLAIFADILIFNLEFSYFYIIGTILVV
jgi:solute carrier family 35 protein F5